MSGSHLDLTLWAALAVALIAWWATSDSVGELELRLSIKKWMRQAGWSPDSAWPIYLGLKLGLPGAIGLGLGALFENPWVPTASAASAFLLPDVFLFIERRARQRKIRTSLSFFLDLLVALVGSGLGLTQAFKRAGESLRNGRSDPLADEVQLVVRELELGEAQDRAFLKLAERTGVDELARVAVTLRLGLRQGSSIQATLETLATQLRAKRREDAMATIQKASAQALFPIFLCGFPAFSVLVFYPAAFELMQALETLRDFVGP